MTATVFNLSQPIVFKDGTMQNTFSDFIRRVDNAIDDSGISATWGSLIGTLADQTDLNTALTTIDTGDITTGTFADARVSESSVTQHEAALSIGMAQIVPTFRDESLTTYSMLLTDANIPTRFTGASPAVTISVEATTNFALGTVLIIRQAGTGTLVLTTTSLTINGTLAGWAQHVEQKLRKVGTDIWDVIP